MRRAAPAAQVRDHSSTCAGASTGADVFGNSHHFGGAWVGTMQRVSIAVSWAPHFATPLQDMTEAVGYGVEP